MKLSESHLVTHQSMNPPKNSSNTFLSLSLLSLRWASLISLEKKLVVVLDYLLVERMCVRH